LNIAPATSGGPSSFEEPLAIFFTIELLRVIESLHRSQFIHGDMKIDNCLVRLDAVPSSEGGASAWSNQYSASGANGWRHKGIKLIDFGRGIDLSLFPAGEKQKFKADWKVDERDCVEMREGREWSYETDYFGLASICYCMLFGKYIATEVTTTPEGGRWQKIDAPLKRVRPLILSFFVSASADNQYWQSDLWKRLFDTLLNPNSIGELPINDTLKSIRGEFEVYLEENCQKGGKNLKSMLKKIETAAVTGRR
jgi:checkpoint serine/threonine-protein kinase